MAASEISLFQIKTDLVSEAAGVKADEGLDGKNLLPYFSGQNKNAPVMFNIGNDVSETNNIRSSQNETSDKLLLEWHKWNAQLKDRIFPTLANNEWWK